MNKIIEKIESMIEFYGESIKSYPVKTIVKTAIAIFILNWIKNQLSNDNEK